MMVLFEILECGLYHKQKSIYASQMCWKNSNMIWSIVDHFSLFFTFIRTNIVVVDVERSSSSKSSGGFSGSGGSICNSSSSSKYSY